MQLQAETSRVSLPVRVVLRSLLDPMQRRLWQRGPDGEIIRAAPDEITSQEGLTPGELESGEPEPQPRRRAHLGLALRLGFRDTYDYLGAVLVMSLAAALIPMAGMFGGYAAGTALSSPFPDRLSALLAILMALLGGAAVGGPVAAGLYRFSRNAAARSEPEVFDLGWGFRSALGRSVGLGLIQALGAALLAGNGYFYLFQRQTVWVVLGAIFGYLLLFWLLMLLYQWPLFIEQDLAPVAAVRKSALLVLDNFGYSLGVGLVAALLSVLLWAFLVPGVLLWGGAMALISTQATRELLRKYGVLGPDPTLDPIADETHEFGGRGWHE